ncbi:MAG: molecular chaperone HtpG [Candidatus Marinimicrobia bacterium]|jgi:molecular chaperone HtpG|nr:molecular chaperone HtpG [Candidatus Neomarinimicrobiota bacterium]MBT3500831.1 molecular chaperone HtpG [Candidatus Neomarinimicrobiota bacterium]MBT3998842.1 molecular chaperone HtpG [Candidatus Neomarinimicrobiota bacterium]MBT4282839.1 molecular chaperone HtpG [Candidatus Neomarinimicrobiota bacterium]MBT4579255.1 molecular chaperone HtpG [Candidatus Neomarinimicrobiota bacterium]
MAQQKFQTEVGQLLHLITHSLYTHKEIFLRELISNASDALDKLRHLTLTDDALKTFDFDPKVSIEFQDGDEPKLILSDSGIGMNKQDLKDNLGTIARSGTKNFLSNLSGDEKKDSQLIGQFGVGFYSCFMVADKVDVTTKKVGEDEAFLWTSDGHSGFEIKKDVRKENGTTITLYLNEEGKEYANRWQIDSLVKKYSDHIDFPIFISYEDIEYDKEGKEKSRAPKTEQINDAKAFWTRSKNELEKKDYQEFYKSISNDRDDPFDWVHFHAEGALEFTLLFYIPKTASPDIFRTDYQAGVKLYVNRVFITDDEKELLPVWLRFVKGIIDSSDLPLNVSREILQQNRIMSKIKTNAVKKILEKLNDIAKNKDKYAEFFLQFGRLIKEGVYQDFEHKDALTDLLRFKSTKQEGLVSLKDYVDNMNSEQKTIYYITGQNEASLRNSPLLEMYTKKNVEVLILDDEIDEIIISSVPKYDEKELKSVNRSGAADDFSEESDKESEKSTKPVLKKIKKVLGDKVKDVKMSNRLSDSPSCIVADENDPTSQMQEILKSMGQTDMPEIKPILEINPNHEIVEKLKNMTRQKAFDDIAWLLYEQALIQEGVTLDDPSGFVKRLNNAISNNL